MGKYTIADPSGFKQKLKIMKKRERAEKALIRQNSKKSQNTEITGGDGVSNSKYSGLGTSDGASSRGNLSDRDSQAGDAREKEDEQDDAHNEESNNQGNQVLPIMNNIFSQICTSIKEKGSGKLAELKKLHMIEDGDGEDEWESKKNFETPLDDLVAELSKE